MAFLGKEIRMKRLLNPKSGKLLAITVDHSIARGIQTGLIPIQKTIDRIVAGKPDAMTMHKGIAESCFGPTPARRPHPQVLQLLPLSAGFDTWVTDVEEAVRMGATPPPWAASWAATSSPSSCASWGSWPSSAGPSACPWWRTSTHGAT
jgi:DhnA family fructose-bisphosphate aldolase class Ia